MQMIGKPSETLLFEEFDDKYEKLEPQYLKRMNILKTIAGYKFGRSKYNYKSDNDLEIIDMDSKTSDIYDEIRADYKIAYRNEDPSRMIMVIGKLKKWTLYLDDLIDKYEQEHPGNYSHIPRKKKSINPKLKRKRCKCK
jgi:hypothetical protein